jgi:hypothetical protein
MEGTEMEFIERNDASLVIVPDWPEFCDWVEEAGYGEEAMDINDSRCLALQEAFLGERDEERHAGEWAP